MSKTSYIGNFSQVTPTILMNGLLEIRKLVLKNWICLNELTVKPGWKWSTHQQPLEKTHLCMRMHNLLVTSGSMVIKFKDGSEHTMMPNDVVHLSPEHDAWVLGEKPFVGIDLDSLVIPVAAHMPSAQMPGLGTLTGDEKNMK